MSAPNFYNNLLDTTKTKKVEKEVQNQILKMEESFAERETINCQAKLGQILVEAVSVSIYELDKYEQFVEENQEIPVIFQSFNSSEDYKKLLLNHLEFLREQVGFWIDSNPTTVLPLMKRLDSTLKKTDDLKDWIFDLSLRLPYGEWFKFEKLSCVYGPEVFMETPNDLFLDHDSDFEF